MTHLADSPLRGSKCNFNFTNSWQASTAHTSQVVRFSFPHVARFPFSFFLFFLFPFSVLCSLGSSLLARAPGKRQMQTSFPSHFLGPLLVTHLVDLSFPLSPRWTSRRYDPKLFVGTGRETTAATATAGITKSRITCAQQIIARSKVNSTDMTHWKRSQRQHLLLDLPLTLLTVELSVRCNRSNGSQRSDMLANVTRCS